MSNPHGGKGNSLGLTIGATNLPAWATVNDPSSARRR